MAKYTYTLDQFPNNKYDSDLLTTEIGTSSIVSVLQYINGNPDSADIFFATDLSSSDQTTLDTIVANHTGEPPAAASNVEIEGALFLKPVDVSLGATDVTLTAIDASGQIVKSEVAPTIYGQEFQYAVDLSESTTTSKDPQVKVTLTTTDLPSGTYLITAAWMASHSSTSSDMRFDCLLNGTQMGVRIIQREPKDPANVYSYYKIYYEIISGINTIDLRYWNENNSTTISDATIELIRVK